MTLYRMAVPAAVLLVSFSLTSAGQVTDDTPTASNFTAPVQTPAQGAPTPGAQKLSPEEMADILMARKDYHEAAVSYRKLVEQAREIPDFLNPDLEDDDPWRKPRQE